MSIASAALSERTRTSIHNLLAVILSSLIFPIVVSWSQGGGWLSKIGYVDAGGCGAIHIVAGLIGLVGICRLGPRLGVYSEQKVVGLTRSLSLSQDKDFEIKSNLETLERL